MMYIMPDRTHRYVLHAWVVANMQPFNTPELKGLRDLNADKETLEFTLKFDWF